MFVKIEPSGCTERKGRMQLRLDMFLEPDDYGYERQQVTDPVYPKEGYPGVVDKYGFPTDEDAFAKWEASLPKATINKAFQIHFIYVSPLTSINTIKDIANAFLHEAGVKWNTDQPTYLTNPVEPLPSITSSLVDACNNRLAIIKASSISVSLGEDR